MDALPHWMVAQLWQVTLLITLAWLATSTLLRQARYRYVIWLVVMIKCVTPPIIPASHLPEVWTTPSALIVSAAADPTPTDYRVTLSDGDQSMLDQTVAVGPAAGADRPGGIPTFLWAVISFWGAGFVAVGCLAIRQFSRVQREDTCPTAGLPKKVEGLLAELKIPSRMVHVQLDGTSSGPAVVNAFSPRMILPSRLIDRLSIDQLRAVLAHEWMHVRRGDLWVGFLQTFVLAVFWFHPLAWLASRKLTVAIESCCDSDVLAERQCTPHEYRQALIQVMPWQTKSHELPIACAIRSFHVTRSRMEEIMRTSNHTRSTKWWSRLLLLALLGTCIPGAVAESDQPPVTEEPKPVVESKHVGKTKPAQLSEHNKDQDSVKVYPITYRVSDLVEVNLSGDKISEEMSAQQSRSLDSLMAAIQRTVNPAIWERAGGPGTMQPYQDKETWSVVFACDSKTHGLVADFLAKKRAGMAKATAKQPRVQEPPLDHYRMLILKGSYDQLHKAMDDGHTGKANSAIQTNFSLLPRVSVKSGQDGSTSTTVPLQLSTIQVDRLHSLFEARSAPVEVLSRPEIRMPSGQTATIEVHGKRTTMDNDLLALEGVKASVTGQIEKGSRQIQFSGHLSDIDPDKNELKRVSFHVDEPLLKDTALTVLVGAPTDESCVLAAVWLVP